MITDQILINKIKQSKVFSVRQNKSEILAALANPINIQLKQQLIDNLAEEYQSDQYVDPDNVEEAVIDIDKDPSAESDDVVDDTDISVDDTEDETDVEESMRSESSDETVSESPDETVSESVRLNDDDDIKSLYNIKDLLNSNNTTRGVEYIRVVDTKNAQDHEVWIHYGDNISIDSDVLSNIISELSIKYPDCQFNRLARTYNAVIFSYNRLVDITE